MIAALVMAGLGVGAWATSYDLVVWMSGAPQVSNRSFAEPPDVRHE